MPAVKHENREHALLSASGADRWLNCTPSPRLEDAVPETGDSDFAKEGTLAHEFGDLNLQLLSPFTQKSQKGLIVNELIKLRKHELYTDEMEEHVKKYTDFVMGGFNTANRSKGDAVLLIEEKLDLTHLIPGGFGTGDTILISDGTLWALDFKYGKGIKVDAADNPQLKIYALGALRSYEMLYDITKIKLVIVQPRLDHVSTWGISVKDLEHWAEEEVKPKAALAYAGKGEQHAGSWCKWCKVKAQCRALAEDNLRLAQYEFAKPMLLEDHEIIDIYKQIPSLTDWAKSVNAHVLAEAIGGKKWDGYKLVVGRANRKWADEEKVIESIRLKTDLLPSQYYNAKLKGIGDMEKALGKTKFLRVLGPYVIKPVGAPTIALETDKRPEIDLNSAEDDFGIDTSDGLL
jgi:hypothetical protein